MSKIAAIQMVSTDDPQTNLKEASALIHRAANQGADFVLLPENFAFIGHCEKDKVSLCEAPGVGPIQEWLAKTASQHQIWLAAGTVPIAARESNKVYGSQLLFNSAGQCVARYDKIHLFDVQIGSGEQQIYRESAAIEAGSQIVVASTPFAKLGLSICYDLRFPELYRHMHQEQVQLITVPSAFTQATGQAHWHPLLRARAIENLCYVIAANQGGMHANGRTTYGHSLIVGPWGEILAEAGTGSDVITAELDLEQLAELRNRFPVLKHRRPEHMG